MPMLVKGWASTAHIDKNNHKVMPGAFAQLSLPVKYIPLLYRHGEHELKEAIGKINKLESRDSKLWCETIVTNKRVIEAIKTKLVTGFSVRFGAVQTVKKVGYTQIDKGALIEISLVQAPVSPECLIVKAEEFDDPISEISTQVTKQFDGYIQAINSLQKYIQQVSK